MSMKSASRLSQQRSIGRVLHKRMLEQICRMRRQALPKQQASLDEAVECRIKTTMIVALARKLLIALWRMVTIGEIPAGVALRRAAA